MVRVSAATNGENNNGGETIRDMSRHADVPRRSTGACRRDAQLIAVDYRMEKIGQDWKAYDVKIEGISLVENYRTTFSGSAEGRHRGPIQALSEKNRTFASTQASAK